MSENDVAMDCSNSDVVTKYKAAAEICNRAMVAVMEACRAGARIVELCDIGDSMINREAASIFNSRRAGVKIDKGVAFPTCVSVNSVVGHYSPVVVDTAALAPGDIVKVDMGVHIDGFIATQGQTFAVLDGSIDGRAADVIIAARTAFEAALRLIKPGNRVSDVAPVLNAVAEAYGCNIVEGVMSHQMNQFIIDGNKCVLSKPGPESKVDDAVFEENEVYAIDVVVSTGDGKPKVVDEKQTTIYKRALDTNYSLKLKASRAVFSIINRIFPTMPFTLRALAVEGEKDTKEPVGAAQMHLGLKECLNHGLLHSYPVLHERSTDLVAQIKGTVLLMPAGSDLITKAPAQDVLSSKALQDPHILELLAQPVRKTKKKNKDKPRTDMAP